MWSVSFAHDRRQAIIPVAILHPTDDFQRIERLSGLIDTGASISAISQAVAERLDLPKRARVIVTTPSGEYRASRYLFRFGIYAAEGSALPIVLDEVFLGIGGTPGQHFDVLIGMDILGRGDLALHRDGTGRLQLYPS